MQPTYTITTKLLYNRDYNEWRVKLYVNGVYQRGADYFTDDKQDAVDTASAMQEQWHKARVALHNV